MRQNTKNPDSDVINTSRFADSISEDYQEAAKGIISPNANKCLPNDS